jgi:hypothetical protein
MRLFREASHVVGRRLSHREYVASKWSRSDICETNQAAAQPCSIHSSRRVCAKMALLVSRAEVVGGGMRAKLSVEDAEQEGATHRGRSSSQPALAEFCSSLLPQTRHWALDGQALRLVTNHLDLSSSTALAYLRHRSSIAYGLSSSSSIAARIFDGIQ